MKDIKITTQPKYNTTMLAAIGHWLALILSWSTNHSWAWLVFHFLCGWFYAVYWAFEYAGLANFVQGFMV